jgi:transposase
MEVIQTVCRMGPAEMSRALSVDLRVLGVRRIARQPSVGVSAASVRRWRKREREQGGPRIGRLGGDRRSDRIEAHHDAVMAALGPGRDATIEEVRTSLAKQGLAFGFGTIQRFFARHAITPKERPPALPNKTAPTS